jgi:L-alanine-DL-glutamate epimerase-like enolase superfamily enzyme
MTVAAISAVDIALWDILGKSLGQPVWRLLGGRKADRLPAYASGGWAERRQIGEQLQSYIAKGGFKAVKMRVGAMDGAPHVSAARVQGRARGARARRRNRWSTRTAPTRSPMQSASPQLVEDCDLAWFEEPVIADDKPGMAEVRAAGCVPIATGESEGDALRLPRPGDAEGRRHLPARSGLLRRHHGGDEDRDDRQRLQSALRAASVGRRAGFFAGFILMRASPASFIIEYSLGANPMIHDLVEETVDVTDGMIAFPTNPGLGFTISRRFLKARQSG